jgi:putative endonuclease
MNLLQKVKNSINFTNQELGEGAEGQRTWVRHENIIISDCFLKIMYKVYILLCFDRSFYVGHTADLKIRLKDHNGGSVRYTSTKRPLKLVYFEVANTKAEAMKREKQIKGWVRSKKINLIKHDHPNFKPQI